MDPWRAFLSTIQFLTIMPWGPAQSFEARRALPFFPLCGLLVGALLVAVDRLASWGWAQPVVALVDVIALAAISGALHLDGLSDTADGMYGRRTPEKALAIMKDSRVGAMGVVALTCCLGVKWAGLYAIEAHRVLWLVTIPAYARTTVLVGVKLLPYGRPDGGTGLAFFQTPLTPLDYWGAVLLLVLSLLTGWPGFLVVNLGFAILTGGILLYYKSKIECITGDMLGAMIELTEAGLFLLISIKGGL